MSSSSSSSSPATMSCVSLVMAALGTETKGYDPDAAARQARDSYIADRSNPGAFAASIGKAAVAVRARFGLRSASPTRESTRKRDRSRSRSPPPPPPPPQSPARSHIRYRGLLYEMPDRGVLTIGRSGSSDITLGDDPIRRPSRLHALLFPLPEVGKVVVVDMASRHGVYVSPGENENEHEKKGDCVRVVGAHALDATETTTLLMGRQPVTLNPKTCAVCCSAPNDHIYSCCGHQVTCAKCGPTLSACPLCRKPTHKRRTNVIAKCVDPSDAGSSSSSSAPPAPFSDQKDGVAMSCTCSEWCDVCYATGRMVYWFKPRYRPTCEDCNGTGYADASKCRAQTHKPPPIGPSK